MYAPVVTLSIEDYSKFLEQLKSGFKRIIKWNKCRSEMTNQTKTKNLHYLIYPTFNQVNRLFVKWIDALSKWGRQGIFFKVLIHQKFK